MWEKCSMFGIKVHLNDGGPKLPCKGDQWITVKFAAAGFGTDKLERLNTIRIHQKVLFWFCVVYASEKYMRKRELD